MTKIYKSDEGARAVRDRYLEFLKRWPVANQQIRVPTRQGETFIVACGDEKAPPLLLFHGSAANSATWMGDITAWAAHFRIYAVDMIGEAGLSAPIRPPLESEAHALWLDDVMQALTLVRASFVGVSLGGWVALDYATRRPERLGSLVLLSPSGVGRQRIGILFKAIALRMCGARGPRKLRETILSRAPSDTTPALRKFIEFVSLIHEHFLPRMARMPIFSDEALRGLAMPVMAILGGKDVLLDSVATKRRLERNVARIRDSLRRRSRTRYPPADRADPRFPASLAHRLKRCLPDLTSVTASMAQAMPSYQRRATLRTAWASPALRVCAAQLLGQYHSVEDAPQTIDSTIQPGGVFLALGGPQAHGGSLMVAAPNGLAALRP